MDDLLADGELAAVARELRGNGGQGEASGLSEALARVAWSVISEPGDAVAGTLIEHLGAAEALRRAIGGERGTPGSAGARALAEGRARWRPRADLRVIGDALRAASHVGAALVIPGDPAWPTKLDDLAEHAPLLLWVRGQADAVADVDTVSLVGARASTGYGEHVVSEMAADLAASGTIIVSGGAYGIDGSAHRAALSVSGRTVAFLAGGVDRAYPAGHQSLFGRIASDGAVISELPCGASPTKWRFLSRNRLIAALGRATVVIEAGWRSGSLNTAGHAASLGRPLGAVPGPVTSAASAGCHRLLREYDAQCVTSAAEVRELMGEPPPGRGDAIAEDPVRTRVLEALGTRLRRMPESIARLSGVSVETVVAQLGVLHLEGLADSTEDGWRRR